MTNLRLPFLACVAFLTGVSFVKAAGIPLFVGTYTNDSSSRGIYTLTIDSETGAFSQPVLAAEAPNPGYLAITKDGRFLYATSEGKEASVGAYERQADGSFKLLNRQPAGGGICHVNLDPQGRYCLVANYGGGSAAVFPIQPDGSLGERSAFVQFTGSGPHPKRQGKPYGHGIYTDAAGEFVYVCDLGSDSVWMFRLNRETGQLSPLDPPAAKVPPGGGARHLAMHPDGRFAYVNNELDLTVTAFSRNPETGVLTPIQTVSGLPGGMSTPGATTAEIACHPSGKWLYVSSRGDNTVSVFEIGQDGKLTLVQSAPALVEIPRGFGIDSSGRWLVVAGQKDGQLAALKIDPSNGKLIPTEHRAGVGTPVCVLFP